MKFAKMIVQIPILESAPLYWIYRTKGAENDLHSNRTITEGRLKNCLLFCEENFTEV